MKTGAELFVDAIEQHGVREIFTLVGDHLNDVLLCAGQRDLRRLGGKDARRALEDR